ncbi:hypothetical protein CNY89_00615 [Amaricoccus sp. HAR-UPW-R2A-40]|nr:hypothetical protein CNY89_00615 [Amaricoccus sp. HAR-UPW-R2A-40]
MGLTRGIHPDALAAITAGGAGLYPVSFLWLDWPGEALRLHSEHGVIGWDGHDWLGVGKAASANVPAETFGMAAAPVKLAMAGLPPAIWEALEDPIRNRDAEMWMAIAREVDDEFEIIGAPWDLYAGYMDASRYVQREGAAGPLHQMQLDLKSGPGARSAASAFHSYDSQLLEYPGDTGGRLFINALVRVETMTWPE